MNRFLRNITLFSGLGDEDLDRVCRAITRLHLPAGAELFQEGEMGDQAYIIEEGEIEIYKNSGGRSIFLALRRKGEIIGEMSLIEAVPRNASGRARTDSTLLVLRHEQLNDLINTSPTAARSMLETFSARLKSMDLSLQQSEKMAQLGTLTAGLAHELNNPAAAVKRGAAHLGEAVQAQEQALKELSVFQLDPHQLEHLEEFKQAAKAWASAPFPADPLALSDLEADLEEWLDARGVEEAWELAPILVSLGLPMEELTHLLEPFSGQAGAMAELLPVVVRWVSASRQIEGLLAEISHGAGRISEIIRAVKSYTYLDQDELQLVNIHDDLQNTLIILRGALKNGITIKQDYDPNLPRIQAYGSELNQVWTNLIANAVDALEGHGQITLRTRYQPPWAVVEIEDNGPGIPPEIQEKLFSPFFTTKPVGKGTGLGLHISYNIIQKHHGEIRVFSRPGCTRFVAALPVQGPGAAEGAPLPPPRALTEEAGSGE